MLKKVGSVFRLIIGLLSKRLVILYQMGKVGSSSIQKALEERGFYVIHLHTLKLKKSRLFYYERSWIDIAKRFITALIIRVMIQFRKSVKIITVLRDPLERNKSAVFQNLDCHLHKLNNRKGQITIDEELFSMLEDRRFIEASLNWFDEELNKYFGIDVFDYLEKGFPYNIIHERKYSVLILNFEKLNESADIIGSFLETDIELSFTNSSSQKWYKHLYNEVKEKYIPTPKSMQLYNASKLYNLMK